MASAATFQSISDSDSSYGVSVALLDSLLFGPLSPTSRNGFGCGGIGGAVALIILAVLLSGQWFVHRQIRNTDATIERASAELEKISQE